MSEDYFPDDFYDIHEYLMECPECGEIIARPFLNGEIQESGDLFDTCCPSCRTHNKLDKWKKRRLDKNDG